MQDPVETVDTTETPTSLAIPTCVSNFTCHYSYVRNLQFSLDIAHRGVGCEFKYFMCVEDKEEPNFQDLVNVTMCMFSKCTCSKMVVVHFPREWTRFGIQVLVSKDSGAWFTQYDVTDIDRLKDAIRHGEILNCERPSDDMMKILQERGIEHDPNSYTGLVIQDKQTSDTPE